MIDAKHHHDPALAPGLVEAATKAAGGQGKLAERLGVTTRNVRQLLKLERGMSYVMQYTLEQIAKETPSE